MKTETPPHRSLLWGLKKQTNPNKHWTAPWMEFLSAVLMLPLLSLWDQSDFNKSCAFLSTFKFGCAGVSHGFYIKCLVQFRAHLFLTSSCRSVSFCCIFFQQEHGSRTCKVHLLPPSNIKDLVANDLLISLTKHILVLIYVAVSCLTWCSRYKQKC